jgi:hypothetical protein
MLGDPEAPPASPLLGELHVEAVSMRAPLAAYVETTKLQFTVGGPTAAPMAEREPRGIAHPGNVSAVRHGVGHPSLY